jgi:hypothetical protein
MTVICFAVLSFNTQLVLQANLYRTPIVLAGHESRIVIGFKYAIIILLVCQVVS